MAQVQARALDIEGVSVAGVSPVSLSIAPGECVALSGPSGAGKTLFLRALADLDAHGGTVRFGDVEQSLTFAPAWRRQVGLLLAESQWWHPTVGAHFDVVDDASPVLSRLGFTNDVLGWAVARLSTGERQRLALLRLLLGRPGALLLDEPTAALDHDNVARVEQLVADYRRREHAPVLWVSHDPEQIARVATRAFYLEDGRVEERR